LIYDLEFLLNVLEDQDRRWKDTFIGHWWDLEQVYATALDNNKLHPDLDDQKIMNDAIENLKNLIEIIRGKLNLG